MRAVVSDTSVLNYLALLEAFALLRGQFGRIIVPAAVLAELDVRPDLPGAALVRQGTAEGWIEVAEPQDAAIVLLLREDLGLGESQAIALAVERSADFLLIDEADGRRRASALGIRTVGTVGVLLKAKRDGAVSELAPILRRLVDVHGFRLGAELVAKVLDAAGETPFGPGGP